MENLENQLRDMAAKNWIELIDGAFKVKQTKDQSFSEDTPTDSVL